MQKSAARLTALVIALTGWFAVITQLALMIDNREESIGSTLLRFFGFFTIDTNSIVASCFSFIALGPGYRFNKFFSRASTVTAITVYITIVGIVYNVILRMLWEPTGLQQVIDELLHSVIPVLVIIFWLIFVPGGQLKWKNVFSWLIYPVIYMLYAIVHGAVTKWYPYPFVNVNELGYNKALINAVGVLLVIIILSLALIAAGKLLKKVAEKKKLALYV